jgi:threonine dehydrogenase-like Zn-dependent dehydrogenase
MSPGAAAGQTMRAQFYQGARRFVPGVAPVPTAGAGEALLRVRRVGICGTDLHIYEGHLDARVGKGRVIGHETFAEVVEAPAGAAVRAGDRVVIAGCSRRRTRPSCTRGIRRTTPRG